MITTPAVLDTCRRCGAAVLAGHSEGLHARVTAAPLNPYEEVQALGDGRWTYDLHLEGLPRRAYLIYRCPIRILGARKWKVLATHRCPPGPHYPRKPGPPIEILIPYRVEPDSDNPPF